MPHGLDDDAAVGVHPGVLVALIGAHALGQLEREAARGGLEGVDVQAVLRGELDRADEGRELGLLGVGELAVGIADLHEGEAALLHGNVDLRDDVVALRVADGDSVGVGVETLLELAPAQVLHDSVVVAGHARLRHFGEVVAPLGALGRGDPAHVVHGDGYGAGLVGPHGDALVAGLLLLQALRQVEGQAGEGHMGAERDGHVARRGGALLGGLSDGAGHIARRRGLRGGGEGRRGQAGSRHGERHGCGSDELDGAAHESPP